MALLCVNYLKIPLVVGIRHMSQLETVQNISKTVPVNFHLTEAFSRKAPSVSTDLVNSMSVYEDFLSVDDEKSIFDEIEPYLKTLRYEFDHWDDAIHGYRETERLRWNEYNTKILDRVRTLAFPPGVGQLKHVHILDLDEKGYIKPHIDAVRFCGDTIAGLSLLSDSVMRLVNDQDAELVVDILLPRRSLYVMKDTARFDYTHEILGNEFSKFKGKEIRKVRRISVICRNEPRLADKT